MPDSGKPGATAATAGRAVVAMSGGVDSSVCAALLAAAGRPVVGLSMRLYDQPASTPGGCCAPSDLRDARAVADAVGIPHYLMDFEEEFRRHVLDYFGEEYRNGRTPVPCIPCNSALKFGRLLERARTLGARRVITGHYARVDWQPERGRYRLRAGIDRDRDQSYFLFDLSQEQLAAAEFPLGGLRKEAVRRLAREFRLPVAEKAESRDLCFVGDGTYRQALQQLRPQHEDPGEIVDRRGRILGSHAGVSSFTVGQRRGLGIPGGGRLYVVELDPARRRVVVGGEEAQYARELRASGANWIFEEAPRGPFRAAARVRYRHAGAPAWIYPGPGQRFRVRFDLPQRALAPGQAVVLYDGDEVLGGGWIDSSAHTGAD